MSTPVLFYKTQYNNINFVFTQIRNSSFYHFINNICQRKLLINIKSLEYKVPCNHPCTYCSLEAGALMRMQKLKHGTILAHMCSIQSPAATLTAANFPLGNNTSHK